MLRLTITVIFDRMKFIPVDPSCFGDRNFWAEKRMLVWERPRNAKMCGDILKEQRIWSFQMPAIDESH